MSDVQLSSDDPSAEHGAEGGEDADAVVAESIRRTEGEGV